MSSVSKQRRTLIERVEAIFKFIDTQKKIFPKSRLKSSDLHHWFALAHGWSGNNVHNDPIVRGDRFLDDVAKKIREVPQQFSLLNMPAPVCQGIKYPFMPGPDICGLLDLPR